MQPKELAKSVVRKAGKNFALGWHLPSLYRSAAKAPVEVDKVLFLETERASLPESFRAVYNRLEADPAYTVSCAYLHKHDGGRAYLKNCEDFVRSAATAQYIFLNDASDVVSCLPLRAETKVVQLWHGCGAFKKWGYSVADLAYGQTRSQIDKHPGYKNLCLVTVSSPEVVWAYEEAMGLVGQGVVQPLGVARTDVFFDSAFVSGAKEQLARMVPEVAGKRILLYAPTFRGSRVAYASMPSSLNCTALRQALREDYVLLVKKHPFIAGQPELEDAARDFVVDVSDLPIDELLVAADVLVTDYSSVIFEYALLGKPMVFFAPDLEEYEQERSFYYDYKDFVPGPLARTNEELTTLLANTDAWFDPAKVAAFRDTFMGSCDGYSTERILQAVGITL